MDKIKNMHPFSDPAGLLFTAEYADVTLFGTFGEYVDYLNAPADKVLDFDYDEYMAALRFPSAPLPTWGDILDAIRQSGLEVSYAENIAEDIDLSSVPETCCPLSDYPNERKV